MAQVIFYEKPGCAGNARQKSLLIASGHQVESRNLLATPWDAAVLRAFFGDKPVVEWFNASSPRVKNGEVQPANVTAEDALALMLDDPLLIRRPLIEVGERRASGFDQAAIDAWIGLKPTPQPVTDRCPKDGDAAHAAACAAAYKAATE